MLYIAYQQWRTNRSRLKFEVYERRLRVYDEVRRVLLLALQRADVSDADLSQFRSVASEADFLFGPEIPEYLEELFGRCVELKMAKAADDPEKRRDQIAWFEEQFNERAKEKFSAYLNMNKQA